ncbi:MAG: hypothetical protein GYA57_10670 [Myxococcales bacterium]|nr:hypothetical protein [Myxococcales bacterium]
MKRETEATVQPRSRMLCRPWPLAAAWLAASWVFPACDGDDREPALLAGEDVPAGDVEPADDVPVGPVRAAIDVLFVVDNSASMAQEQEVLSRALPEFLRRLYAEAEARGVEADVHVGVTSTDAGTAGYAVTTCGEPDGGDRGCLLHEPSPLFAGCDPGYPPFLSRSSADGAAYPIDELADDLACVATLGTQGCGFEQPFGAARRAVGEAAAAGGCNEGFLRPGSAVAVIYVSDEDDCTVAEDHPEMFDPERTDLGHLNVRCVLHRERTTAVAEEAAALRALEAAGHVVVVGAIVGVPVDEPACTGFGDELEGCLASAAMAERIDPVSPSELVPSCNTAMGLAFPPRRFVELAQAFGDRAYVASICVPDYKDLLVRLAGRLFSSP